MSIASLLKMIRTGDDPVLSAPCEEVLPGESLTFILENLKKVCAAARGLGLAAPQIGCMKRVVWLQPLGTQGYYLINPTFEPVGGDKNWATEACLSYPGVEVSVRRWTKIRVKYMDEKRVEQVRLMDDTGIERVCNMEGRIAQHEIDHLSGVCYVRTALEIQRQQALSGVGTIALNDPIIEDIGKISKQGIGTVPIKKGHSKTVVAAVIMAAGGLGY